MAIVHFLIRWFAENKIVSNLLMISIFACAFITTQYLPRQIFPDISVQGFTIASAYPGASASIVEHELCYPIENAIRDIDNISKVVSLSKKQLCSINVSLQNNKLRAKTLSAIKANIEAINNFPSNAQKPSIYDGEIKKFVARLIISGNIDLSSLYNMAQSVIDELSAQGINNITFEDPIEFNTLIEVPSEKLANYQISLAEIAKTIETNNKDISSGEINSKDGKIVIQSLSSIKNVDDLEETVIRSINGVELKLKDLAKIQLNAEMTNRSLLYDGHPAISLVVEQGNKNNNLSAVSKQLKKYIENKKATLPKNIALNLDNDVSVIFDARMQMLMSNAISGLALVFITLFLFLNFRLALWVSVGIPISFCGALVVLYLTGDSLNMVSTFAFLIMLGIVVDDSIVISESIYNQQQNYVRGAEGAIIGAATVAKPVFYAMLTTVIMFSPLLFVPGSDGALIAAIPIVAIATLIFSLLECFLIMPSHLAHDTKIHFSTKQEKFTSKIRNFFELKIRVYFGNLVAKALDWRYAVIACFLLLALFTAALLYSGWLKTRLLSPIESDEAFASLELPEGTSYQITYGYIKQIEHAAKQLKAQLRKKYNREQILHIRTHVAPYGDHSAIIFLTFPSRNDRKLSTQEIAEMWRDKVGKIPLATRLEFESSFNKPGPSIDIQLSSKDQNALLRATQELYTLIASYPAAYGVQNNIKFGTQEVGLRLKPNASTYNINTQQLALIVNQAFHGIYIKDPNNSASSLIVRLPENERNKLWHLEKLMVPTLSGAVIPLNDIAALDFYTGESEIVHYNFKRSLNVSAYVDESISSTSSIMNDLKTRFLNQLPSTYPTVNWQPAGALEISADTKQALTMNFCIALIFMFLVLVFLFKSLIQPLIVLSAVPFGIVGALLGHWLLGYDITIWSFAGIIAVSGVVVNDNVVLMDFINEHAGDGKTPRDIAIEASVRRFRPIFLTAVTTSIGMLPFMFETSWEAQFLIPMVISISFGELFSTMVGLILTPILWLIYHDVKHMVTSS